jgi:alpha-beta hydrolase superfamily lysophospholipase
VQIRKYPDHFHELWNETDRETIFFQMKSWIDQIMRGTF